MAEKEVRWTLKAINDRIDILDYWIERNKSKTYSIKLDKLFERATSQISKHPKSGKISDHEDIRVKVVQHYLIFYQIQSDFIYVVRLWDSRRNPRELTL